jgi:hypothetical protein
MFFLYYLSCNKIEPVLIAASKSLKEVKDELFRRSPSSTPTLDDADTDIVDSDDEADVDILTYTLEREEYLENVPAHSKQTKGCVPRAIIHAGEWNKINEVYEKVCAENY